MTTIPEVVALGMTEAPYSCSKVCEHCCEEREGWCYCEEQMSIVAVEILVTSNGQLFCYELSWVTSMQISSDYMLKMSLCLMLNLSLSLSSGFFAPLFFVCAHVCVLCCVVCVCVCVCVCGVCVCVCVCV